VWVWVRTRGAQTPSETTELLRHTPHAAMADGRCVGLATRHVLRPALASQPERR